VSAPDSPAILALFGQADASRGRGDLAAAYNALEQVVALDPGHPRALNTLALRSLNSGNPQGAATMLAKAANRDPQVAAIRLNQADAARALGDRAAELAFLDAALALDPYLVPALIKKAQALESQGSAAVSVWKAVLKTTPPGPDRPAPLAAILAHATAAVESAANHIADRIAPALAAVRAAHPPGATVRVEHGIDRLLGRRRVFVPEPTDLLVPRLPADEFFAPTHFPWIASLEAAAAAIQAELQALLAEDGEGFAPYVNIPRGVPENQWAELNKSNRWSAWYLWKDGVRQDSACARCPETARIMESLPLCDISGKAPTAFFSLLMPGSRIPAHTGVTNCRAICHLALVVPPKCGFRVGSEIRQWREGQAFVFDDSIEHEAWNESAEIRAVLILDVWNPYLTEPERAMLRAYYGATRASQAFG